MTARRLGPAAAGLPLLMLLACGAGSGGQGATGSAASPAARPAPPPAPGFDSARALRLVEQQVAFGPRVPGSEAHRRCADWLRQQLEQHADEVELQAFEAAVRGQRLPLSNIVARFRPELDDRVLLAAHWDSRPTAEHDPVPERRWQPTPGANDGGSGVAVLLELARLLAAEQLPLGVDIVLFDGEDYGDFSRGYSEVLLGSQHFARLVDPQRYRHGVLLDMVGRRGLRLGREGHSRRCCRPLLDRVWALAGRLGHDDVFVDEDIGAVIDDHLPLIQAGLPTIDLIDLADPVWHTTLDTPERLSTHSLGAVGEVVWALLVQEAGG